MLLRRRILTSAFAVAVTLGLTTTASAQTAMFPMVGQWAQNRGNLIDIPLTGDRKCFINRSINPPPPFVMGDYGQPLRAARARCVPGSGTVTVMGAAPQTITLKGRTTGLGGPAVFNQTGATKQSGVLPLVPTVIQLATNFTLTGPGSVLVGTPTPVPSGDATGTFMASAHLAQIGRAGPNFAWCPGTVAANGTWTGTPVPSMPPGLPVTPPHKHNLLQVGGCTTPNPNLNGAVNTAYNGLVRYRGGANVFGGTMSMLIKGTGTLTVKFAPLPTANGSIPRILHLPIGGMGAQHPGSFYAKTDFDTLVSGTVHPSPVYSVGGLVTGQGPSSFMYGSTTNLNYGFPWTSGHVYAKNTGTNQGMAATTTLSATGSDARFADGQGSIIMVAGGTSHRLNSGQHFSAIDVVRLVIGSPKTPSSSPAGLAAGAVLMLLAVGYAVRRRF